MTDIDGELSDIDEFEETQDDSPPHIKTPVEGATVTPPVVVTGAGHAGRNVRMVTPGLEDALSTTVQMGSNGNYQVAMLNPPSIGRNFIQAFQWKQMPSSYRRSAVRTFYYMPPHVPTAPALGAVVNRRPIFSGHSAAPGATVHVFQAGSGVVLYASIAVAANGTFSGSATTDLPLGQFIYTARYTLDGRDSAWAQDVLVTVK
ncbi:hypothetical protein ACYZT9_06800 [Pseudomonas sp. ZT5P21]